MRNDTPVIDPAAPAPAPAKTAAATAVAPNESHYHSKKDRVFVRGVQGSYNLTAELARLRALPRVRKGSEIKFNDGPQAFSRHYVEPKDGITQTFHLHLEEYGPGGKSQKHGHVNEAAFYILDGDGYEIHDGVRYDWTAVHRHRPQQLRAPALQRQQHQAGARAGHQDQADVPVHEHAVPAAGRAALERAGTGRRGLPVPRSRDRLQPSGGMMQPPSSLALATPQGGRPPAARRSRFRGGKRGQITGESHCKE